MLGGRITCPIQPNDLLHDQQKLGDLQGGLYLVGRKGPLGGFIAEIRTPLTPLTGLVQKIEAGRTDLHISALKEP